MATEQEKSTSQLGMWKLQMEGGAGWWWFRSSWLQDWFLGSSEVWGVFFVEFVLYFEESAQGVSWITSIGVATQQLLSPIGTAACNAYGARPVVMTGGFLSGLGFILASQATTLTHLYLTMGLVSGSGWALVFTPTIASVMEYFRTRRSLAMGLGFTGVGLSSFAFSPLFQYLVQCYGWRGALLILGGLSFNIVASGALLRPLGHSKALEMSKTKSMSDGSKSFFSHTCEYFELSLLLHRGFLIYSLAVTCFNAGYFIPYVHLVAHSRLVGFSEFQAAFIISSTGVTDIIGRVVSGWVSDLQRVRSLVLLTIWTGLLGLFLLLLPLSSLQGNYACLLTVSLAYGFCAGAMTPLVFSVVPEIVGMEHMVSALGLLQLIESVGGLFGAPLSGWLRDLTGSFICSFVVAGVFLILGTMITMTLPHFCSCTDPLPQALKKTKNEPTEDDVQVLTVDSSDNIQSTDRISETLACQNNIRESGLEVEDTSLSTERTEDGAGC